MSGPSKVPVTLAGLYSLVAARAWLRVGTAGYYLLPCTARVLHLAGYYISSFTCFTGLGDKFTGLGDEFTGLGDKFTGLGARTYFSATRVPRTPGISRRRTKRDIFTDIYGHLRTFTARFRRGLPEVLPKNVPRGGPQLSVNLSVNKV